MEGSMSIQSKMRWSYSVRTFPCSWATGLSTPSRSFVVTEFFIKFLDQAAFSTDFQKFFVPAIRSL